MYKVKRCNKAQKSVLSARLKIAVVIRGASRLHIFINVYTKRYRLHLAAIRVKKDDGRIIGIQKAFTHFGKS